MNSSSIINHHTVEMLTAALPYMNSSTRRSIQVLAKTEELFDTFHHPSDDYELSACNVQDSVNIESLLNQLKGIANPRERETIDMILNFFMTQKMFQAYRTFMQAKSASHDSNANSSDYLMEFLLSQLSPDQKGNFENMSALFQGMKM